ncbi:MAG: hypothetical protein NTW25_02840, partial [Candidatus Kapabacteria bacterium]|nr:hypothetical protein [Candidatus Kapabacteria bacterium]
MNKLRMLISALAVVFFLTATTGFAADPKPATEKKAAKKEMKKEDKKEAKADKKEAKKEKK